jgi:hypothetical protein
MLQAKRKVEPLRAKLRRVKRRLGVALAVAVLLRCAPGEEAEGQWVQVNEQTACEALAPSLCVGIYGFMVKSDGSFTVGPAPNGARITGTLTESERAQLSAYAVDVDAHVDGVRLCESAFNPAGTADRLDLITRQHGVVRVFEALVGQNCTMGGLQPATRLHDYVKQLMSAYYPRPFPP